MVITDLATLVLLSLVTSFIRRSRSHHQRRREQPHQTSLTASSSSEVERRAFWSLYLNDLPDPCDGGHEPIFLTNRAGRITGYICQRCSDDQPPPSWICCKACRYTVVSGFVLHDPCHQHARETAA